MYKIFIRHDIFYKDALCGYSQNVLEIPFPPFKELIIRDNNIDTDLSCCWHGPIFNIQKNEFEFTGITIFPTEQEAQKHLKKLAENGYIVVYASS